MINFTRRDKETVVLLWKLYRARRLPSGNDAAKRLGVSQQYLHRVEHLQQTASERLVREMIVYMGVTKIREEHRL